AIKMRNTSRHQPGSESEPRAALVAQVSNLLYRRFPIGRAPRKLARLNGRSAGGLEIRDTADRKSALRGEPCAALVAQVSNLLYRRFPIGRAPRELARLNGRSAGGSEIRDTADRKSALRGGFTPRAAPSPFLRPGTQSRGDRIVSNVPRNS